MSIDDAQQLSIARKALMDIRREALGDDLVTIWCIADEALAVMDDGNKAKLDG
ncbi:hypothetical protein [Alicyclobacillus dauci]|uniref:Uncharacterized protein n=1 Tax=Alicyclobacillus dauci TaxID=1475485 RepID=A0ABY6YXB4_9BACL|nr:hypothetical protein [Alicyclobacillus dauci]WAH35019.1 hypothetical protein NZD86_11835 [Alicyclobacillus dauci]